MADINYRGNIFSQIEKAMLENPTMTVGEILFSFLHKDNMQGKHYFYASDQEIYMALERFNKFGVEQEEPIDEVGFEFWAAQKNIVQ